MKFTFGIAALAAALLVAGCGPSKTTIDHVVSAPRGTTTTDALTVASGVTTLHISSARIPGSLYVITTPDVAGIRPAVSTSGNSVDVQFISDGHSGSSIATLRLSSAVRWQLHLNGGATDVAINFTAGGFGSIDLASGASSVMLSLPKPNGTQAITESGGASAFTIVVPRETAALVRFTGGVGSALLEGQHLSGIAGGRTFQMSRYSKAKNRFNFELTAGVSSFALTGRAH